MYGRVGFGFECDTTLQHSLSQQIVSQIHNGSCSLTTYSSTPADKTLDKNNSLFQKEIVYGFSVGKVKL